MFSAARPPAPTRSGKPIGVSTATIAGRSGAASTSAKREHDPHACVAALWPDEGRDPAAGAAIDPGKPCILIRCAHCPATLAQLLRHRYAVISGGDP